MPKEAKDIREHVLKVLLRDEMRNGKGASELRILSWIIDGKETAARLERREKYVDKQSGEEKMGKAKGLSAGDLQFILNNAEEILGLMTGKVVPAPATAGSYDNV